MKIQYQDKIINDLIKECPLDYDDLDGPNDATDRFQDLYDFFRQVNYEQNAIYCRGTTQSGYVFLQYWHFEPSSSAPESTDVFHEGDWEMFQIAVEPNTAARELQPFAITASQHYYGQTIRWDSNGFDNGPASQDQDYVGKSGYQPKIYIALNSHATYFRSGWIHVSGTPFDTSNHGEQYTDSPRSGPDDECGESLYSYVLYDFDDEMIPYWKGRWGEERWTVPGSTCDDGPRSPRYRNTEKNMWTDPKGFNNYYLKLKSYPDGDYAHPELEIP